MRTKFLIAAGALAGLMALPGAAHAQYWRGYGYGWGGWHRPWYPRYAPYYYRPRVYYVPPPVVYAPPPPPMVYAPPPVVYHPPVYHRPITRRSMLRRGRSTTAGSCIGRCVMRSSASRRPACARSRPRLRPRW